MLECVIFDMDGTLLDSEKLSVVAWQEAGRAFGFEIPTEFIFSYIGMSRDAISDMYYARYGADFPMEAVREKRAESSWRSAREGRVKVKPGARELLKHLRSRGVTLALATSSRPSLVEFEMKNAGLWDYFAEVLAGPVVAHGKPAPDIYLEALRRLGCSPENALVIEDSENGAKAGLAAGCKTIVVPDLVRIGTDVLECAYAVCGSLFDVMPIVDRLLHK